MEEVAGAAQPDTILGWYRRLIANKFDGSRFRKRVGRPRVAEEIERLVVRMAKENPSWGYDRIVGALANLGHCLSDQTDQTVGNVLRRHGISPAPKRKQSVSWANFIRSHRDVLVEMDFFTTEVLTLKAWSGFSLTRPRNPEYVCKIEEIQKCKPRHFNPVVCRSRTAKAP